jgi:hypothetical protein
MPRTFSAIFIPCALAAMTYSQVDEAYTTSTFAIAIGDRKSLPSILTTKERTTLML